MLVLSRKKNESIVIAEGLITIVVVEIRGDKVRLGIEAAKDISVHRQEVYEAIQRHAAKEQALEEKRLEQKADADERDAKAGI